MEYEFLIILIGKFDFWIRLIEVKILDFESWLYTSTKKKTSFRRKLDSPKIQHPLIFPIFALGIRESFTYIYLNTRVCSNTRKIIKPRQKNQLPAQHVRNFSSYICE